MMTQAKTLGTALEAGHALALVETGRPSALGPVLVGFVVLYAAFEVVGRLSAGLSGMVTALLLCSVAIGAGLAVEAALFRRTARQALAWLGLGVPAPRAVAVALLITLLLFACYPLLSAVTGAQWTPLQPVLWLTAALFVQHLGEEVVYRGFLFRHLRQGRSFPRAVLLCLPLHAAAHIPIIATGGLAIGLGAIAVALAHWFPFCYVFERGRNTVWGPAILHFGTNSIKLFITAEMFALSEVQAATMLWLAVIATVPYVAFAFGPRFFGRSGG
jgi:membrane protease YdiL (CAAX protease family)